MLNKISDVLNEQNELMVYTKQATKKYTKKYKEHVLIAISSALGLIIGLAWKDLINKVVELYLKTRLPQGSLWGDLITAIVITAVMVAALVIIYHFNEKKEENK